MAGVVSDNDAGSFDILEVLFTGCDQGFAVFPDPSIILILAKTQSNHFRPPFNLPLMWTHGPDLLAYHALEQRQVDGR